ncbi:unnamed protein product [Caenorhabditis bovis]|uniref:Uncharacterized protein n=1 Tax=Caenorhabditis bovis TaxID=2654633 RepID=A0A8S1EWN6_9PELO|nr:unnamed protein product [Caenorhabditis bovis]
MGNTVAHIFDDESKHSSDIENCDDTSGYTSDSSSSSDGNTGYRQKTVNEIDEELFIRGNPNDPYIVEKRMITGTNSWTYHIRPREKVIK